MRSYFVSLKYKQTWLRPARLAIAGLAAVIAAGDHAGAANGRKERAAGFESRNADEPVEPIMAIVSLRNQRITIFDAKGWVLRAASPRRHSSGGATGRLARDQIDDADRSAHHPLRSPSGSLG